MRTQAGRHLFLFLLFFSLSFHQSSIANTIINPIDYGLLNAKTGSERYYILFKCHEDAVNNGWDVSYKGIDIIELEIPSEPKSIPLPKNVDFSNVTLKVLNNQKDFYVFEKGSELHPVAVNGKQIDERIYTEIDELKEGSYILIIKDEKPWVENRRGHDYGHIRRDIVLVEDGIGRNGPISSYTTVSSMPKTQYCPVTKEVKIIKNLNFERVKESVYKTYLIHIVNQYNIKLEKISIFTPDDEDKYGDAAIRLTNCYNVNLNDVTINGTYSQEKKYGYGISINNVYGLFVKNMQAQAKWGVFGTNNLQNVLLFNCDINRFDIHCYGRDVIAMKCKFKGLYNQFSSIYGRMVFYGCEFDSFVPFLVESSYNAYTPFDLLWHNCVFHLDKTHNYLLTLSGVPRFENSRPELRRKCLPNIMVKNCKVIIEDDANEWFLVRTGGINYKDSFDYISKIEIKNLKIEGTQTNFKIFSEEIKTTNTLNYKINE